MTHKYEITDIQHPNNPTLFRIRALIDIPSLGVNAGDLGGYIESEWNLSQEGDSWVGGDAQVYDGAHVFHRAHIFGNARVFKHARIFGNAQVYDNASIYDRAKVFDNAQVRDNAQIFFNTWVSGDVVINKFMKLSVWGNITSLNGIYYADGVTIILISNNKDMIINGIPFNSNLEYHKTLARLKLP